MKKKLYIHIGSPATGTTSIQHFMMLNRDKWAEEGYGIYSRNNVIPDPQKDWFFNNVWVNFRNGKIEDFLQYANNNDQFHSFILSEEFLFRNHSLFSPVTWDKLKDKFDIIIILYLRRLDECSLSMWKWHTKFLWTVGPYNPPVNAGIMYWNEKKVIENILKAFPGATIKVRSFAYPKDSNLIMDFVNACDCGSGDWNWENNRYNVNPTMDVCYALLKIKEEYGLTRINPQFYNGLTDAAIQYSIENPDGRVHPWSYRDRYRFCQTKSEITKWTEDTYFNGYPLYKPLEEYVIPWREDKDKINEIAIKLVSMAADRGFVFYNDSAFSKILCDFPPN